VIGYDETEANPICVDEANRGRVITVDTDAGRREWFTNSSVQRLARCLVVREQFYRSAGPAERVGGSEAVQALVALTERRLRRLDPEAFSTRHRFLLWPTLLDAMSAGM
jgi:hypothetical protein